MGKGEPLISIDWLKDRLNKLTTKTDKNESDISQLNSDLTAVSNRIKVKTKTIAITSTGVATVTDTDFKTLDSSFPIATCNILYQGYPCAVKGISINGTTGGIQISTDKTSGNYAFQIIAYNEKGFVN